MDPLRFQKAMQTIAAAPRPPRPWRDGTQLPWNDPEFSRRMLTVHLDQTTHMASRTLEVIHRHVRWLWNLLGTSLPGQRRPPATRPHLLEPACGPGFYCHEFARRGGRATGCDFSPAALEHAAELAASEKLDCRFLEADLSSLPDDFAERVGPADAATIWFGEFHSFPVEVGTRLVSQLVRCLRPGGIFLLEFEPFDSFPREGGQEWRSCESSPFSDRPHLWLQEHSWDEEGEAEINVHWIVDAVTGELSRYAQCHQAYRDADLTALLHGAGLDNVIFYPPIVGVDPQFEFPLCVARRP